MISLCGDIMNVRKCVSGEMEKIIETANKCFIPHRDETFTFVNSVPYIYNNKSYDYSDIHFVIENDEGMIAVGGNLINNIKINNKLYTFSVVGTIGTLPGHRNKGYMKMIMEEIEKENVSENLVFSVLTGDRDRYNHYGYERSCISNNYVFTKNQVFSNEYNVVVKEYKDELDELYNVYLEHKKIIVRGKDNFLIHLNNNTNKLYVAYVDEEIVGYYSLKSNMVVEICIKDIKYLKGVISRMLELGEYEEYIVMPNILDRDIYLGMYPLASSHYSYEESCIKIYNDELFLEILYSLNKDKFKGEYNEVYKIGDKVYEFNANSKNIKVIESNKEELYAFDNKYDFIRFALGVDTLGVDSKIFPMYFDLNRLDRF